MKLDRNTNRSGRGKYALVNMRKLIPLLDKEEAYLADVTDLCECPSSEEAGLLHCFHVLVDNGIVTLGDETPGDQFFVMKYKDKFTAEGLRGYASSISEELKITTDKAARLELAEFCAQMFKEVHAAEKLGNRIPD